MLDVDGQVISQERLVQRVTELLAVIDAGETQVTEIRHANREGDPGPVLHSMSVAHGQLHPPDLDRSPGTEGSDRGPFEAGGPETDELVCRAAVDPPEGVRRSSDRPRLDDRDEPAACGCRARRAAARECPAAAHVGDRERTGAAGATRSSTRCAKRSPSQRKFLRGVRHEGRPAAALARAVVDSSTGSVRSASPVRTSTTQASRTSSEESSGEVQKAQERYLTLFPPPSEPGRIVDIGCGRGEMLELLRHEGQELLGVDTDAGMVDVCTEKGLPAVVDDGIHFLSQTQENSLKGIFCAQVVEHLITPELEQLVRLALRCAANRWRTGRRDDQPEELVRLGNHFYADTSHVRPVHPETLRFICEQVGFRRVQLEERSPHPTLELADRLPDDTLGEAVDVLLRNVFGYQDYMIVATK